MLDCQFFNGKLKIKGKRLYFLFNPWVSNIGCTVPETRFLHATFIKHAASHYANARMDYFINPHHFRTTYPPSPSYRFAASSPGWTDRSRGSGHPCCRPERAEARFIRQFIHTMYAGNHYFTDRIPNREKRRGKLDWNFVNNRQVIVKTVITITSVHSSKITPTPWPLAPLPFSASFSFSFYSKHPPNLLTLPHFPASHSPLLPE
jgi:hypothetical protein